MPKIKVVANFDDVINGLYEAALQDIDEGMRGKLLNIIEEHKINEDDIIETSTKIEVVFEIKYKNKTATKKGNVKPTLTPIRETGGSKTGNLEASYDFILQTVGKPNVTDIDDPDKVKASWGFKSGKRKAFIWCYKHYGPVNKCQYWSTDGDASLLKELFGDKFN